MRVILCLLLPVFCCITAFSQNVGISTLTPSPTALLHVDAGASTTKGFLITGTRTVLATVPDLGAGARLMFYPGKSAFRAGTALGAQWDNANVGIGSTGIGTGAVASGQDAVALGTGTTASGLGSTAMGSGTIAAGQYATSLGNSTTSSGYGSTAMGSNTVARANFSTAMGYQNKAKGFASTVMGIFSDSLLTDTQLYPSETTPLFILGNGDVSPSNALVIQWNGKMYLDPSNKNNGDVEANALLFGEYNITGEGIASKRTATGNQWGLDFFTSYQNRLSITNNGNVGIGTSSPSQKLQVNGNICYTGIIAACSDMRYKKNVIPLTNALVSILSLHGIYYNWDKEKFAEKAFTDDRQLGFSAQEIEALFPEIVQTDAMGYMAVDYSRLTPVLVEAVKDQQKQIIALQLQVDLLGTENKMLKNMQTDIDLLKAAIVKKK